MEHSGFWTTNGVGDGAAPYTQADLAAFYRDILGDGGVLLDVGGELAVSGSASPLAVAGGAALIDGLWYRNTTALSVAVTTPGATTGGHVVLEANQATQQVRVKAILNSIGTGTPPAVQQSGGIWQERLATFQVNSAGVITLTDARTFASYKARLPRRQGGSAVDWSTEGTTNYTLTRPPLQQMGMGSLTIPAGQVSASGQIGFPQPFSARPLVFVSTQNALSIRPKAGWASGATPTHQFGVTVERTDPSNTAADETVYFSWLAIGPG